ncbi:PREDICTED: IQ domain-containing protein K-like [Amphimedon queenslandica]|nr:PREDICTED: IQ domain-containing protein K-like [Amphimedon queenslandica]|eukprot:XP_003382859.1 PREDICTED: IQ domain-containing protein K-like [Amphimedon queenslandica]
MAEESATSYLEREIFPVLLPGLEEMLHVASTTEKRKRFNSLDYLVEYLYKHNPRKDGRDEITLAKIPFVEEEWKKNPRPPLPPSATLSEDEARLIIQAAYRGYRTRCREDVQLFREWQKGRRKEINAVKVIQREWRRHREEKDDSKTSEMNMNQENENV